MEKVIWIQRVFINLLDSYSSRNIGKFLSNCVVSDLTWRNYQRGRGRWKYLWCQKPPQPNWRKAYSRSWACFPSLKSPGPIVPWRHCAISWEDLLMCLLEYDVIIYNITEKPQQMEEAIWAVSGQRDAPLISRDRTFMQFTLPMSHLRSARQIRTMEELILDSLKTQNEIRLVDMPSSYKINWGIWKSLRVYVSKNWFVLGSTKLEVVRSFTNRS